MSLDNSTDYFLITRLQRGDTQAFEQFFDDRHARVYAFCRRFVRQEELAEEVVLDVFMTVWKKRDQLNASLSLDALLFKITKDLSFNCLKKSARSQALFASLSVVHADAAIETTADQVQSDEYDAMAHRAIQQLPPQRRKIFNMRRQHGMSHDEIAQKLGISKNTVKVQLVKATKFMRAYLTTHADISFLWFVLFLLP